MGHPHAMPLLAGAAVVGAAGAAFTTLGGIEVAGTSHPALRNGWLVGGLVLVLVSLAMAVIAGLLYWRGKAADEPRQRTGIDSTGGSIKGQIRIRQQDRGIVSRDTDISGEDIDIE